MHWEHPKLFLLLPFALVALVLMLAGDVVRRRAFARLGDPKMIDALVSFDAGPRRAAKGVLRIVALIFAVVAAAGPKYGRGTKTVPAADVSAMIVLDVSKSMYAQDVMPSRLERARSDAVGMIKRIPQIRWGAVAFSGEAVAYPPTSDPLEVEGFLRAHEPASMPGGTAIAKALELARRQLLPQQSDEGATESRPTKPAERRKPIIILITDGEDLEGDPVSIARAAYGEGVRIHVVAIGGRAPQPIPNVDPDSGVARGFIKDELGGLVTTELTPQAETQLRSIATEAHGRYVRSTEETTGIASIEADLKGLIVSEGVDHVEILFNPIYAYPLAIAFLLLLADAALGETPMRKRRKEPPAPPRRASVRRIDAR